MPNSGTVKTLAELAKAVVAKVYEHQRICRCVRCFREGYANCLDCPACRIIVEDTVHDLLRAVNRRD